MDTHRRWLVLGQFRNLLSCHHWFHPRRGHVGRPAHAVAQYQHRHVRSDRSLYRRLPARHLHLCACGITRGSARRHRHHAQAVASAMVHRRWCHRSHIVVGHRVDDGRSSDPATSGCGSSGQTARTICRRRRSRQQPPARLVVERCDCSGGDRLGRSRSGGTDHFHVLPRQLRNDQLRDLFRGTSRKHIVSTTLQTF